MLYKILIVDDDEDFLEEVKELLEEYTIVCAKSGREALQIFHKPHLIDLVILDVNLPDMAGTEILKEMKKKTPGVGIIISTGQGNKEVLIDALRGSADDYLEKPFSGELLTETIQRILKSQKKGKSREAMSTHPRDINGKIELAKRFAKNNLNKKISLNDVAKELCLSPKYFSRTFMERTGQGFNEYRLKLKYEEAKKLLTQNHLNTNEVARLLGYENIKPLTRLFKKYSGGTPGSYKRQFKKTKKNVG
ncbi:MAG: response regulator [Candidatus Omnitrophica bacterium]|nr:response regulator [Candidatus Omnitrophota bacterium]